MINVIVGKRMSGKTHKILEAANNYNGYVVCRDKTTAQACSLYAENFGFKINFPMTFEEFLKERYIGRNVGTFHIDDAHVLLQGLTSVPIQTVTMETEV